MKYIPSSCDYLVVGAGATGMAFVDSLILGLRDRGTVGTKIVLVDQHESPGGQWHDSYPFVRLHQPSAGYGVESTPLEPSGDKQHLATRREILEYYQKLQQKWETSLSDVEFCFVGRATLEFDSCQEGENGTQSYSCLVQDGESASPTTHIISVHKRLVDARYLQPDLPIAVPPKFTFDPTKIRCIPVNDLATLTTTSSESKDQTFVIIGGGKTGMDAMYYLLTQLNIPPTNIVWVVPHDPWITAREHIGNCMEFLHDVVVQTAQEYAGEELATVLQTPGPTQQTFVQWESKGKLYRLFDSPSPTRSRLPSKFNDATLSREELQVLRQVPDANIFRGHGRIQSIDSDTGDLVFHNGTRRALPFANNATYVHCSAGAFNYTHQIGTTSPPVFTRDKITLQDVYGTPGFCFVGSVLGKLESLDMSDADKNAMCLTPQPPLTVGALGPSGGDVAGLSPQSGMVQRLCNLRQWLHTPTLRQWLVGHRLFNLGHYKSADDIERLVQETYDILNRCNLLPSSTIHTTPTSTETVDVDVDSNQ